MDVEGAKRSVTERIEQRPQVGGRDAEDLDVGMFGEQQEIVLLTSKAREIGYPVLLKATAGGGGKGMRIAHNDATLKHSITMASNEAEAAFGDGGVYLEKFLDNARHVEVQILADEHGRIVTFGERECSIQRRHQKLIEEAPSVALSSSLRAKMCKAALKAAKAIGYTNAGKSTLFNALVKARAYAADQLFATLDTTTRQLYLGEAGRSVSLSDTVGFIRDLPHGLVEAFQATLQEATEADLLRIGAAFERLEAGEPFVVALQNERGSSGWKWMSLTLSTAPISPRSRDA